MYEGKWSIKVLYIIIIYLIVYMYISRIITVVVITTFNKLQYEKYIYF